MDQMNTYKNHHDQIVVTPIDDQVFDEFMFATKLPFLQPDFSSSSLISPFYSTNSNSRNTHNYHHRQQQQHHQNSNNVNMMMNNGLHQTQPYYPSQELFMTQKPSTNPSNNNSPQIISFGNPTSSFISDHDHNNYYYKYNASTTNDHPEIMSLVEDKTFSFCTSTSNSKIAPSINLDDLDDDQNYAGIRVSNGKNVNSQQNLCHVQAERKRRERLSALFISLSRVVPGLKKEQEKIMAKESTQLPEMGNLFSDIGGSGTGLPGHY